jgi:50S ribosomal protein L16 3-hydroxylase
MLAPNDLQSWSHNADFISLVTTLLNQGYWYLAEVED